MTEENRTTMRVILCRPNERRGATSEYTEGAIQVQERSGHVRENLSIVDADRKREWER